jgi:hypothetical protein
VALSSAGVLAAIIEIALGHDPKGTNGGEYPTLGAVDLIHAIALPHWTALTAAWEVEVLREHVARVTIACMVAFAAPAAAAAVSVAEVVAISIM